MPIASLEVDNFRNLRQIALQCSPSLNLIVGENASGKTSLLEALYYLGRGRSFRTRQVRELIHTGQDAFRIVAILSEGEGGRRIPVGIQRSLQEITARIDGAPVRSLAELAIQVPILLLNPDSHRLLEDGPQQRRRFIDWGLFHTDQTFLTAWKRYGTALRNRNAALRANSPNRVVDAWDEELAAGSTTLDSLRNAFCKALESVLRPLIEATLGEALEVEYDRGWPQGQERSLAEWLRRGRDQDRRQGYTRLGPHRADFQIRFAGRTIAEYLSRGQQKLLVIALVLAQARLYRAQRDSACILLIDDLPAELDRVHRARVMRCLAGMDTQLFVTAIEGSLLDIAAWPAVRVFKMDHGAIGKMV